MSKTATLGPPVEPAPEIVRQTFRWDMLRGASQGVLESVQQAFALVIAIRVFHASEMLKPFVAAGWGLGLLFGPFIMPLLGRLPLRPSSLAALCWLLTGAALALSAMMPTIQTYVIVVLCAQFLMAQNVPLITQLLSDNYPASQRGKRLAMSNLMLALSGVGAATIFGWLLDANLDYYRIVLLISAAVAWAGAFAFWRIPSSRDAAPRVRNPLEHLELVRKDTIFRQMLIGWMFMGLGNLMMLPLRAEYLANPAYGLQLSNTEISLLLVTYVAVFRILSTFVWGYLFDRFDLIYTRIAVNLSFMAYILIFFHAQEMWQLVIGSLFFGIATGGGGILWQIWVTKVAPPHLVGAYMSIHGGFTGLRSTFAPFLGFGILAWAQPSAAAWTSSALILISSLLFLPLRKKLPS
ncbi:MAG: MFS transporter [Verrucomicrobiota bacterium JB022]|nr:MFS transporter [Verrucomicrobiota bacterium JB022]